MGEYIHALTIQQCNPIVLGAHQGIKVLKFGHYYQRHTVYLPYFMAPFARGTSLAGSHSSRWRQQIMNRNKENRNGNEEEMKWSLGNNIKNYKWRFLRRERFYTYLPAKLVSHAVSVGIFFFLSPQSLVRNNTDTALGRVSVWPMHMVGIKQAKRQPAFTQIMNVAVFCYRRFFYVSSDPDEFHPRMSMSSLYVVTSLVGWMPAGLLFTKDYEDGWFIPSGRGTPLRSSCTLGCSLVGVKTSLGILDRLGNKRGPTEGHWWSRKAGHQVIKCC